MEPGTPDPHRRETPLSPPVPDPMGNEPIPPGGWGALYPREAGERVLEALRAEDESGFLRAFDAFLEALARRRIPAFLMGHLCLTLVDGIDRLRLGWRPDAFSRSLYALAASPVSDFRELTARLEAIRDRTAAALRHTSPAVRSSDLIAAYIEARFAQKDFSVSSVAEHFGLSPSSLRRHFKRATGYTVQRYVDEIRIREAARLLGKPHIPIKQIVSDIGYSDYSSFIRKFRQSRGYTPAEFRRRCPERPETE